MFQKWSLGKPPYFDGERQSCQWKIEQKSTLNQTKRTLAGRRGYKAMTRLFSEDSVPGRRIGVDYDHMIALSGKSHDLNKIVRIINRQIVCTVLNIPELTDIPVFPVAR
jgi:hypothetical protein